MTLAEWSRKCYVSKHELQVLLDFLSHAASVVGPGHVFLRRLIDIAKKATAGIPKSTAQPRLLCRPRMVVNFHW